VKIGLIKLDGKHPNLALEKLRVYYNAEYITPIQAYNYDRVYCSSIFTFTDKSYVQPDWICGGTGFDLTTELPKEIETIHPHINWGVTTRGCIRKCWFCVAWKKEGNIRVIADLYDIWDGKSKNVVFIDNNILAVPEHFIKVCSQAQKENIKIDFNQGLDIRLLTKELAQVMKDTRMVAYRFAFDSMGIKDIVVSGIEILKSVGINFPDLYVFAGPKTSFDDALSRLNILRELKARPYLMRHEDVKGDRKYISLARWANQRHLFAAKTWEEFLEYEKKYKPTKTT